MTDEKQTQQPSLQILAQYIKDLSFEAPGMPFLLAEVKNAPKIDISIDVNATKADKEKKLYTVDLVVKVNAKAEEKTAFLCELTYGGLVELNIPDEHIQPVLLIEIPHLLFPYVRAIIANVTREAGLAPLSLAPIDFASLYRNRMEKEAEKLKSEKAN